jgi:small multidrug resistance family-3 protein
MIAHDPLQSPMAIKSVISFVAAGFCEIGGGYLVCLWLRENKSSWHAVAGAVTLVLYGVTPTLQPANSDVSTRLIEAGLLFSLSSGAGQIDKIASDSFAIIGGAVALVGVFIIMYWPRNV